MKIGYKGTDELMKCRGAQYAFDITYTKPEVVSPKICSADGFHYCNKLTDIFSRKNNNGKNRFFEVEILGNFTDAGTESITTSFRFLRELTKEEITKQVIENNLKLHVVKQLQIINPRAIVCGSVALYLNGIRLKRFSTAESSDIDIIVPYFSLFENFSETKQATYQGDKKSGNDFDNTLMFNGHKIDLMIKPKEPYEIITHDGFDYKVVRLEETLKAKLKYAGKGNEKHKNDIYEMIGKTKAV